GSPLSQQQQQQQKAGAPQANGGQQAQAQAPLGSSSSSSRPGLAQFASPHMASASAPRVVPTQRTKSHSQLGGAAPPPGTAVAPGFSAANSFHAMQRLMSPAAGVPLALPTQGQPMMSPAIGSGVAPGPQGGDMRRASSASMPYAMPPQQQPHPQGLRQAPGFAPPQAGALAGFSSVDLATAAAAMGVHPQAYASAMLSYAHQQQSMQQSMQRQQHMHQIGGSIAGS
ncbi:hypothetical protein GGI00_003976, partial [Coemansia sp. RSA 2681]